MDPITFSLDGEQVVITDHSPTTTALQWLRGAQRKIGTKEGCAEGDCGACTIAILDHDAHGGPAWRSINSCLVLVPMLHGRTVVTVEGLKTDGELHPVQDAMVRHLGSQCGYCTPGVVMTMFESCYRKDLDADWKVDDQMCGTLCRCTGYRPIRDAALETKGLRPDDRFTALEFSSPVPRDLTYVAAGQRYFQPTSTQALFEVLASNNDARVVCGMTDLGLDVTKKHAAFPCLVSLEAIPELRQMSYADGVWRIGATVPLSEVEQRVETGLIPLARMLRYFGARQIKNRATVGGNLCTASPIGDLAPALLALGATVVILGAEGERRIPLSEFFLAYRKTALNPGEILSAVEVPDVPEGTRCATYKVSKRRELDISAVSAGFYVTVDDGVVTEARLAFGGMAATPARATSAEKAMVGQAWTHNTVEAAVACLATEFTPFSDHRGSAWYRTTVAQNLLRGFYDETHIVRQPTLAYRHTGTVLTEAGA